MFGLNFSEVMVVGIVAILLFGKRLPEVAKSLGSTYRQFRSGLSEFHNVMDTVDTPASPAKSKSTYRAYDDYEPVSAPKFEPPPSEPTAATSPSNPSPN